MLDAWDRLGRLNVSPARVKVRWRAHMWLDFTDLKCEYAKPYVRQVYFTAFTAFTEVSY